MAKKKPKSQLDRVLGWDPSHLAAVLGLSGITLPDFKKLGRYQQGETFRQAYETYKNRNNPDSFTTPMTLGQANVSADAAANLKYGAQESALNQQIKQTPLWYQQYKQSIEGARSAAQQYQQGLIDKSNETASQIGNAVLQGMSPDSIAAQQDKQAAESRKALAGLGTDIIRAGGAANDQYFGGRAGVADASQIQAMANLLTQKRQLAGEKADYRTSTLNDLRTQAQNASIAQSTLANNVQKTTDAATAAEQASKDKAAARRVSRKNTRDRLAAQKDAATNKDNAAAQKEQDRINKEKAAKHQKIQAATGTVRNKIADIQKAWAGGGTIVVKDKDGKPIRDDAGKVKTRKAGRGELRGALSAKYGAKWVEIMETVRDGKPLTQDQIDYLHNSDPNVRIPREWISGTSKTKAQEKHPHDTGSSGSDKAPHGAHGHI